MIAIDTNVVVRFLTRDDPVQAARARDLIGTGSVLVLQTVILESEWVLRTTYRFDRAAIARGLRQLLGIPGVEVDEPETIARALDLHDQGFDFADALHLGSGQRADAFATFDHALRRRARRVPDIVPVIAP